MYAGETFNFEHEGRNFRAFIERDDDCTPPWERECWHVNVSGWERRSKRPSEVIIINDEHGSYRFVCIREAMETATRESWGLSPYEFAELRNKLNRAPTKREIVARAVQLDIKRMRAWCADQWEYIGVCVCLLDADGQPIGEQYSTALWGIESDADEYIKEVARELTDEVLEHARAALASIADAVRGNHGNQISG